MVKVSVPLDTTPILLSVKLAGVVTPPTIFASSLNLRPNVFSCLSHHCILYHPQHRH
ncbi:hypothetical protein INT80_03235 [Gallibacterium anatis]|uniref:Uncharacterized protein n=1 Tax=Gallibacterium anatis TaxID=750 RepID=A0A930UX25_9PAST|nr:hypothetical protein [Gallibacterium anatis]